MPTEEEKNPSHPNYTVLKEGLSGGPLGLGDPDDMSLRKVETEVMIPQKMKERAKHEKCAQEVKEFADCARGRTLSLPFVCRKQSEVLRVCLSNAYEDPEFREQCTKEYLHERSFFRRTGIRKKQMKTENSM